MRLAAAIESSIRRRRLRQAARHMRILAAPASESPRGCTDVVISLLEKMTDALEVHNQRHLAAQIAMSESLPQPESGALRVASM